MEQKKDQSGAVAGCALHPKRFILDTNGLSYEQIAAISAEYRIETHIVSCIINAAVEAAPLPDQSGAAVRGEAVAEAATDQLYSAVMNIPCERTMSHFVTLAELRAYKEGHQDARHAAVNLVAAFKSRAADALDSQPTGPAITPHHIELIQDMLIWPVTEDDARTARDMLQELHFDLSMASSQPTDGGVRNG